MPTIRLAMYEQGSSGRAIISISTGGYSSMLQGVSQWSGSVQFAIRLAMCEQGSSGRAIISISTGGYSSMLQGVSQWSGSVQFAIRLAMCEQGSCGAPLLSALGFKSGYVGFWQNIEFCFNFALHVCLRSHHFPSFFAILTVFHISLIITYN
jgi:hypothetical protein